MSRGPVVGADGIALPAGVVVECEISSGVPAIAAPAEGSLAFVLVRVFSEPIGLLSRALPARGFEPEELASAIVDELGPGVRDRVEDSGLRWTGRLPTRGLRPPRTPRFLQSREHVLREGPEITVAVCTRDRPEELVKLLDSLARQRYERLRILVVDNAPSDARSQRVVSTFGRDVEYVTEPRPGLSWARNRAIEASDTEVIAWADDDEVCDCWWAAELARGFVEVPAADAVTGIVIPVELETQCQSWFEQYSGVSRGRGFARAVFSPATAREQSPLYPLPPYGAGANMAFRREALERIGGFDCALGAGTPTLAGEDTAAFSTLLLAGGTIVYQPTAIVYHRHRRDYAALRRVMVGYG
ncbi:MAG TPA: glycosyltransferase, partial [Solirubrobacteraceae bacterium]